MAQTTSFEKYSSMASVDQFINQGKFEQTTGTFKLGTDIDSNHSKTLGDGEIVFVVGSAYTQGNQVRSFFDMNDNGSFLYSSVERDRDNIKTDYSNIFKLYPNLNDYPYLYPLSSSWNAEETITQSKSNPLYRYSGKGLGKIEFYNTSNSTLGNMSEGYPLYLEHYANKDARGQIPLLSAPRNINGLTFPSSGLLYSGTLVQYNFEKNDSSKPYKNVKVTPYQAGRGIPQWDETKEYFGGKPFGIPFWEGTDIVIEPQLSPGVGTANNDFCVGVAVDTEAPETRSKIYKYQTPTGYDPDNQHVPWFQHPAPFTAPPKNISFTRTPRIFSPGPNSAGNYWAPWPSYYAYQPEDEVPVMTTGKTTLKIGAACNIGMQAYYEPDVEVGDNPVNNPNYVSVSCVPLFQGEKVKVGSEIFASAMGQVITWDRRGVSPYTPGSFCNVTGVIFTGPGIGTIRPPGWIRDAREENPWYDWMDSTFGAIGWTSTPAFLLSGIPDQGTAIIETKEGTKLSFMVQSNQGSVIVQGSTVKNPLDDGGSGRMTLLGPAEYNKSTPEESCHNLNFEKIKQYPQQPGRSQPIGHTMQEIEGKGRWQYSGEFLFNDQNSTVSGFGYTTGGPYYTKGGTGQNCSVEITSVDFNGSVTGVSLLSAGTGYSDGDILTVLSGNTIKFADGSLQFSQNSFNVVYSTVGPSVSVYNSGSRYKSATEVKSFNLTKNNLVMEIETKYSDPSPSNVSGAIQSFSVHSFTDASQYPVGTIFYLMNTMSSEKYTKCGPLALFEVLTNDGVTITVNFLEIVFNGDYFTYPIGKFLFSTQKINQRGPTLTINANNSIGSITRVGITDIGEGNDDGDIILIQQEGSQQNFIFSLDLTMTQQNVGLRLIEGGSNYVFEQKSFVKYSSFNNRVRILNPGGTYSGIEMKLGNVNNNGSIKKISYNFFELNPPAYPFQPDFSTYTGTFGSIQTIEQTPTITATSQPVAGAIPPTGWPNFAVQKNATFQQGIDTLIINGGTGYTIGGPYPVTGGSGIGLEVAITSVDSLGSITSLKVLTMGENYIHGDYVVIGGSGQDSDIKLVVPKTQRMRESITPGGIGLNVGAAAMYFGTKILEKGSGYTVGGPFPTTVQNRDGINISVNILKVDSNGGVLELEIDTAGLFYRIGFNLSITAGDGQCVFQLTNPVRTQPIKFTKQGTNYTTATGVSTYNLTSNNLYTICGLETTGAGQCQVIDYTAGDIKPPGWNFSRYAVGDIVAFNQNGNVTATAEITSLSSLTQEISFTQLTPGTGYIQPATPYGFLSTINTSQTPTTVDIVADVNGFITEVKINTLGSGVQAGDFLVIEQGDSNAVVQVAPLRDVPPQWQNSMNGLEPTALQWNEYKRIMKESVNLLDYPLLTDFFPNSPNYMNNSYYTYGDEGVTNEPNIGYFYE